MREICMVGKKGKLAVFVSDDELSRLALARLTPQEEIVRLSLTPVFLKFPSSYQVDLTRMDILEEIFKRERITRLLLVGRIPHNIVFALQNKAPDHKILQKLVTFQGENILQNLGRWLKERGINIIPLTKVFQDFMARKGLLAGEKPAGNYLRDIEFGRKVLQNLLPYHIGQSLSVKNQTVIAVEGLEGTDEMIKRTGKLCQDFVVVKMAGRKKDIRFDLPVVGPGTIKNLARFGGRVLGVESGRTIIAPPSKVFSFCKKYQISLVGI